ncbi:MAG: zinc-binding dehydrogenase [Lachnospiraceae bacterium]|jgi:threonine dehydrogenase-like Zn-dependent dehydrogenase|nr:zinc-binding dehydrogenase [Lachnospiraceae bacterium]
MKGFGMIKAGEAAWLEKERPVCGPLDAIVKPTIVAPCSSDTHAYHTAAYTDRILGHEAVGIVEEVGELVTKFKPGDEVVVPCCTPNWLASNMQEMLYTAHDEGLMASFKYLGAKDGVFGEVFHVNQADANLVHMMDGVKPEAALMTVDMMSTGFHAVENAEIKFGDTVCVIGIGPVGLMAVAGCAIRGASRIIAVGTRPKCVEAAKEYGATDIVSYKTGDIVEQVKELTGGGVDKTIIAGGNADTMLQAIMMTKPMGIVSNVNFFDFSAEFKIPALAWGLGMANIDIRGGFCPGGARRIERMMELIKYGRIDTTKIISHTFHGFDKIEDAFWLMDSKVPELIKPIVYID